MDVDAVRALLPWWVGISNVVVFLVAVAILTALVTLLARRLTLRRFDPAAHWTERARVAWVVRGATNAGSWIVVLLAVGYGLTRVGPLSLVSGWLASLLAFLVAFMIAGRLAFTRERRLLGAWLDRARWQRAAWGLRWLMWSPWVVTMLMVTLTPTDAGVGTWLSLAVGALALLWLFDDGVFQVLRWLGLVRPAHPELLAIVGEACAAAGRPTARTQVLESWMSNAFAQRHCDSITFTSRALEVLTREELVAVAHHEVGHLAEGGPAGYRRWLVVPLLVMLGALPTIVAAFHWVGALVVLVGALVLVTWLMRVGRRSEVAADVHAHDHGNDATTYMRALEKLHEHNLVPAVQRGKRHTHPDLWDRMQAAGVEPGWARPAPPADSLGVMAALVLLLTVLLTVGWLGVRTLSRAADHDRTAAYWSLALTAGDDRAFGTLGRTACEAGRLAEAEVMLRAAYGLAPRRAHHGTWLARAIGRQGASTRPGPSSTMSRRRRGTAPLSSRRCARSWRVSAGRGETLARPRRVCYPPAP